MREEVRLASDAGLDGFAFDILGVGDSSHWKRLLVLLEEVNVRQNLVDLSYDVFVGPVSVNERMFDP